jgi:3-phosphoshikimate 1-carboxyvinyltransferase
MSSLPIKPLAGPVDAVVDVPGSKSLTNRALIVAALANGTSTLNNVLFADDTHRMLDALQALGLRMQTIVDDTRVIVIGCNGMIPNTEADLFCGNAGTTMRFCAALTALANGTYRLDGVPRMRERPIGQLAAALETLGARVEYEINDGYPPIIVHGKGLDGATVHFDDPPSSQLVSAILMVAPYARNDVFIDIAGPLISKPYVRMTTQVMADFGVHALDEKMQRFIVSAPQRYTARTYDIEPDASNATYFLAVPALVGGTVTVRGLGTQSVQGDANFVDVLEAMGCTIDRNSNDLTVHAPPAGQKLKGIDVDLNAMPDTAQTLGILALFADGPTTIRNIASLRVKETDRIDAMATELTKLGAKTETTEDSIKIHPPEKISPATIDTYDDHRMAMAFALAGLAADGVVINDPECVNKTFPNYFDRLNHYFPLRA